jgi:hypothetical protein
VSPIVTSYARVVAWSLTAAAIVMLGVGGAAAYECPKPPQQVAEDVTTEAHGSTTALLSVSSSSYDNVARNVSQDLLQKYPNADRVLVHYATLSIACQVIMASTTLSDSEKLDRIFRLDDWMTHDSGISGPVKAEDESACPKSTDAVLDPIRKVFSSWAQLDINGYLAQWSPDAIHRSKSSVLDADDLARQRRADFGKYARVEVLSFSPNVVFVDGRKAVVNASYSMRYWRKNGQSFTETESENYALECSPDRRWVIRENNDYLPQWSQR